jgi:hypothetical protein
MRILDVDPGLAEPRHAPIAAALAEHLRGKPLWGRIS